MMPKCLLLTFFLWRDIYFNISLSIDKLLKKTFKNIHTLQFLPNPRMNDDEEVHIGKYNFNTKQINIRGGY